MVKFKAGDTVEAIESYHGQFTKGKTYTVREHSSNGRVLVEKDDRGAATNGWGADNFKLVTPPASQSPIRTRREIVPGVFGDVMIEKNVLGTTIVAEFLDPSADELREAAHILNQIAEVLEENAG